ncbi:hypothetical protein N7491_006396 [Penicillium cf. griseofulvum]|uniref:Uncharacterized protein n=1 Tax=Penicillium cf. griseofulvum TaxID=2972120 RepID=A0A9W9IY58_9EURO|nr:hypothetical protein N7472_010576 [Penicillium cf. griseofulvum]KAJ5429380.1 hypothetical protein N7491_006396 [Penicillium cf. griseofulvum]KAJ5436840.1 hypothetical protein N7445_007725 [Penicillium cf. griseofulvum]
MDGVGHALLLIGKLQTRTCRRDCSMIRCAHNLTAGEPEEDRSQGALQVKVHKYTSSLTFLVRRPGHEPTISFA